MKTYIGIDVSTSTIDISSPHGMFKFENSTCGFKQFLKELRKYTEAHCVCESTGGYEKPLCLFLVKNEISVSIENPYKTKSFLRSLGGAKTDKADADYAIDYTQSL